MKLHMPMVRRLLWPEKPSLFVIIGGAVGMAGDMAAFFTGAIGLPMLAAVFAVIAAVSMLLCLQRASLLTTEEPEAVRAVVECRVCDAMRFGLFATLAFVALLLLGQGQTMTETMGEQLGLIRQDVSHIAAKVDEISDITQSQKLVDDPSSAEDFFRNSWIYMNIHRDPVKAFESISALYARHGPVKLDAADAYFNAGRQVIGRDELLRKMEDLGRARRDASMLVIAARNAASPEEAARLAAMAREINPEYPFAHWDIMAATAQMGRTSVDAQAQVSMLTAQVQAIEDFLRLFGSKPASVYFFLPQYQPDYEQLARQQLASMQNNLESYRRAAEMRRQAEEMRRNSGR